jgi:flavin reductase (DIM6/NTAB) family NADH-FMN oxidoreductase RutF
MKVNNIAQSASPLLEDFRSGMRLVPSGVCLLTARDAEGNLSGMAVTSATSISMSPPSMMVAINQSASLHPAMIKESHFCLNLLGKADASLIECFSRGNRRDERFSTGAWRYDEMGIPVLSSALSAFICCIKEQHDYGTHTVFFAEVTRVLRREGALNAPLVWLNGRASEVALSL